MSTGRRSRPPVGEARPHRKARDAWADLQAVQATQQAVIESLPFDVWTLGADGRYELQNSTCRDHWGDVRGRRPADVAPDEETRRIWEDNNRRALAGEVVRGEVSYAVRGERRHLFNLLSPVTLDGAVIGVVGVNVDISERVRAEEELRRVQARLEQLLAERTRALGQTSDELRAEMEQREALAAIVNLSPVVAFRYRSESPWSVEYVSENIRLFGYLPADFLTGAVRWPDITHPEDHDRLVTAGNPNALAQPPEIRRTYRIRTASGTWRWVDEHTVPHRDAAGRVTHYQGIVIDVTDQRATQDRLLRSERLAAVGMLAAGVAHEFNNVHTSMLGFAQLALEIPGVPARARDKLQRVIRTGQRANHITQNLLAFTRGPLVAAQPVDVDAVLRDLVTTVEGELAHEGIAMELACRPLPPVLADRHQLGQVLVNLITNARHALIGRPEKCISIGTRLAPDRCGLTVQDTGCGIPPENRARLFLPFFSTKGEYAEPGSPQAEVRGTGLGLSVCDTLVRSWGGELTVESEVSRGTTFTVWIPRATSALADPARLAATPARPRGEARVLVIDDDRDLRELLGEVLTLQGYTVETVPDETSAWRALAGGACTLLLVDLRLPGPGGLGFLAALRARREAPQPRVVLMSGGLAELAGSELVGLRVDAVLAKPFTTEALLLRVAEVLASPAPG